METSMIQDIIAWIVANGITLVAIGWTVEKLLRLIDKLTPETWTWDDNLADIIAKVLKAIAKIFPQKTAK